MTNLLLSAVLILEIGAGANGNFMLDNDSWDNADGVGGYFSLRLESDKWLCHLTHYSQWDVGPPFNDEYESSLDHIGCAVGLRWM